MGIHTMGPNILKSAAVLLAALCLLGCGREPDPGPKPGEYRTTTGEAVPPEALKAKRQVFHLREPANRKGAPK